MLLFNSPGFVSLAGKILIAVDESTVFTKPVEENLKEHYKVLYDAISDKDENTIEEVINAILGENKERINGKD